MTISQNCQSVRGLLMLYLDSELDATTTHSVNQHLVQCSGCRERFESEQLLESALVRELEADEGMPDAVWERLKAGVAPVRQAAPRARRKPCNATTRTRRLNLPVAASLAAAAMLVAAVFLWQHDPGVQSEPSTIALVPQLAALHRVPMSSPSSNPARTARSLLTDLSLPAALLPATGLSPGDSVAGHPVRLLGAERVVVNGQAGVSLHYDCCGTPTTVFVIPRSAVMSLPPETLPAALSSGSVDDTIGGLLTHSVLGQDVFLSVVSEHSVVLAEAWLG